MLNTTQNTTILFIDAGVANVDTLLAAVSPDTEIHLLRPGADGLQQIADTLAGRSGIDAVHVVSHGGPGFVSLGGTVVDTAALDSHADALAAIRAALTDTADLMLYGCDVAQGESGSAFINALAAATGADVAASTDLTGAGGNWTLEAATGEITAAPLAPQGYEATLGADSLLPGSLTGSGPWNWGGYTFLTRYDASLDASDPDNPLRPGSRWDRYVLSGIANGTTVRLYMGNSSTVDDYLQIERNGSILVQNDDSGDGERSYDSFLQWTYQAGDVIRATTYAANTFGSYSLYINTSSGATTTVTDIGSAPAPAPPPPTAPLFTDSHANLGTLTDTGAADSFAPLSGTLTASDSTPNGGMTFSGGGASAYGSLSVASNGGFSFTPNAAAINALAAGQSQTVNFTVQVADGGGLASTKTLSVTVQGANDAPTLVSDAAMTALAEDQALNNGATAASLFTPRFSDVDTGSSLGGVVVVGNTADAATEGAWQYSTDAGAHWFDLGAASASAGVVLSAGTRLRFAPVDNYNGTPGGLTVHAVDNSYAGGYTSGGSPVLFNTTSDALTSGVSVASRTLSVTVNAVDDAPVFTSAPGAVAFAETAVHDTALTPASGALSGTLTATDVDSGAFTFHLRGGVASGSTMTLQGTYGLMTLDEHTGEWHYAPTQWDMINALHAGQTATETFTFKAEDSTGAFSEQNMVVTITGADDAPVMNAALVDQSFDGTGAWAYQVPANTFTDADGQPLTYTVQVLDADGNVVDTLGSSVNTSAGNVGHPSYWLAFDPVSRTLSGTPPNPGSLPLTLRVTATDASGEAVADTMQVGWNVPTSGAATPVNATPLSTSDHLAVSGTGAHLLSLSDFGHYTDAEGSALAAVRISTLPAAGQLEWQDGAGNWVAVTASQVVTADDIAAGRLQFVAGAIGDTYASIGFQVSDGTAFSASSYTLSVDVAANPAPTSSIAGIPDASLPPNLWSTLYDSGANPVAGFSGSVRVVVDITGGGTIRLGSTSGVTVITQGYGSPTTGTATSLAFEGTEAAVNAVLESLQVNRGTQPGVQVNINAIAGGAAYDPNTGHYYEVVDTGFTGATWSEAKAGAEARTFNGLTGYLATITSSTENAFILSKLPSDGWIGASDAATEGVWQWASGPEAGTTFSNGNGSPVTVAGQYANWNPNEPNDSGGEDYAEFYASGGSSGRWNDLPGTSRLRYYIVEYGGTGTAAAEQASRSIVLTAANPELSVAGQTAYTENAVPTTLAPALALSYADRDVLTQAAVQITAGRVTGDALAFTNPNDGSMGNIAASYNASTGQLTLTSAGGATLAQWHAALEAVTYASSSDNPGSGTRTLTWTVYDGAVASNAGTTTVAVTAVNDAPHAVSHLSDLTVGAGGVVSVLLPTPLFTDPEGGAITLSARLADGSPLPDWLSFNPATGQFSGNAPAGVAYLDLAVIGTDTSGVASETSFRLNLASGSDAGLTANSAGSVTVTGTPTEGQTLTAVAGTDADGSTGPVQYQWQVSHDGGITWVDVAGDRGRSGSLTLAQTEAGQQVRVQTFYGDAGAVAEAPVSSALAVANVNDAGTLTVSGGLAPGQTLDVTLADPDGITGAAPTYVWQSSTDGVNWTPIAGATYSAYALTNADGGHFLRALVSYTDDLGSTQTATWTSGTTIQLGAVAPVAANDTASATEAGGLNNAVAGSGPATGHILGNDTDANAGDHLSVSGVRVGSVEGVGTAATLDGTGFTLVGHYGTLTMATDGSYSYQVDEANADVQALAAGATLAEQFNYTVSDLSALTDTGVLQITVHGTNDLPVATGLGTEAASEDVPLLLSLPVQLIDPDSPAGFSVQLTVDHGTLRITADTTGLTVSGSDTGTVTITGAQADIQIWLDGRPVSYVSAPNDNGTATLTVRLNDGTGYQTVGTESIGITAVNDAPLLDIGGSASAGNDHTATFRPRGGAVAVVGDSVTLSDIDGDTFTSATLTLASGARDNLFGTVYETLTSSAGTSYTAPSGAVLTIAGNGTTVVTITGAGTHADYEAALRTVVYNDTNPNAFAGDRTVTIAVTDGQGAVSNTAAFATAAANAAIAVGQRIFIDGTDSGCLVAQVLDSQHFVASAALGSLAEGSALSFHDSTGVVTTATEAGPLVATTTVQVPWTPVIDMNGESRAGRDNAVTWTEGGAAVALATSDASITDQGGLISTVTVTLTNPLDGAAGSQETLQVSATLINSLLARGITVSGNGTHAVTFTAAAGADATNFQIGLRGVTYQNTSQNPNTTQRVVSVSSVDVDHNIGVGANTVITLLGVNDAPAGVDGTVSLAEDGTRIFALSDFGFTDPVDGADGTPDTLSAVVISTLPASGTLLLGGVAVTAGQHISAADLTAGLLTYVPVTNVSGTGVTTFTFQVQDNGGTARGGVDLDASPNTVRVDVVPVNDAPVLAPAHHSATPITEDAVANGGQTVATLLGAITDADSGAHSATNGTRTGMAVYATGVTGPGTGHWQYNLGDGAGWHDVSLSDGQALLLRSTDAVRFVPDTHNGATGSLSYCAWDQATGVAGTQVDVSVRGGTTAFSTTSDTVSVVVTPVNDAPVVDLNGTAAGLDGSAVFHPRGDAAALFDSNLSLTDADVGDRLTSATLVLNGDYTLDNDFGVTYETLHSTAGASWTAPSGAVLSIAGQGTAESPLLITGTATAADYEAVLRTVVYENTNPNAYAGIRPVTVTVTDDGSTTGGTGVQSSSATLSVDVTWGAVVDLNGDLADDRDHTVSYVENNPGLAIAAADASLVDQDGNLAQVRVHLTDPVNGSAETLFIAPADVTALASIGVGVTGNNSQDLQLYARLPDGSANPAGLDGTYFQLGLRMVRYTDSSDAPGTAARHVVVSTLDVDGNSGVPATTTLNPVPVNDLPSGAALIDNQTDGRGVLTDAQQYDTLHASHTLTDADGMATSIVTYQWLRNGVAIDGASSVTYALTQDDVGTRVSVVAIYTDDAGFAEAVFSTPTNLIVNVNDAPVAATGVALSGNEDAAALTGPVSGTDIDHDTLSFHTVGAVPAGVTLAADGTVTVVPLVEDQGMDDGESREVTFQYVANDGTVDSVPETVTVTIHGVNDAPVAATGVIAAGTEDDAAIDGAVSGTDVDVEALTYALVGEAPAGVTFNADGTFSVAPLAADQGLDDGESREVTFQYVANDGTADSAAQTVTVTIHGVNDAPVAATGVTAAGTEDDATINGTVSGTDVDVDALTYALVGEAPAGVTFNADGTFSVAPLAADQGLDDGESREVTFQYVANDGTADSAAQTVTVTIHGVNDAPVAAAGVTAAGTEDDAAINGAVSGTDVDVEGLTYALVGEAPAGVTFNADGTFSVAPLTADQGLDDGESREVTFQYVANDGTVDSIAQTVTVTIHGVNDAPVAASGVTAAGTEDDAAINGTVSGTDVDVEALTYALVGEAPAGVTFNADGTFSVAPLAADQGLDDGESREVTFQYVANDGSVDSVAQTVTVTIHGVNDAPVAAAGVTAAGTEDDAAINGAVSGTDVDVEGLTYALVGEAPAGVTFNADGTFSVAPLTADQGLDDGESREVTFQYVANDGSVDSVAQTVTVTIHGVNDAPVAASGVTAAGTEDDAAINGAVSGTDVDVEGLTYALVGEAPAGVTFNADGTFSVAPLAADQGLDDGESREVTFQYVANDGTVDSAAQTVTVTIHGVNDAPVAASGVTAAGTEDDAAINGAVSGTDVDVEGLTYALVGEAPAGVTFNADGTFSVAPLTADQGLDDGESREVTFQYVANDGTVDSVAQTVTVTIHGVNDAPVAAAGVTAAGTEDDAAINGAVSGTDVDVEGLTYALVGEAPAGVTFNADGTFSVAPLAADQGLDDGESREVTFQYVANDGSVDSAAQTVTVTIHGVNDAPVAATGVTAAGTEDDAAINGAVFGTDVDVEGLTYALVGEAPAGVTFNADGTFSVAPLAADQGLDDGESREVTFQYVANDGTVDSAAQTVTVTIHGVNDAPVAAAGVTAAGTEDDAAISGTVSGTDVDVEGLTYALVGEAPAGVTFNADGTFSVAPLAADQGLDDGESREVTFQYVANDGSVDSVAQTVTVTIHGVNDAPVAAAGVTAAGTEDDAAINGAVSGTDVDVEGLTYALVGEAPAGVTFNADGTFSVAPLAADQGLDDGESREVTFQYVANDGTADSAAQTVTVTIHGVNDAPVVATGVTAAGTEDDATINGTVSGTDVDVEALTYALVGEAPAGVTFNADGTFSVAPLAADQGLDDGESREVTFQYVANDGSVDSVAQTVTVTIHGVNDAPVAAAGVTAAGTEDDAAINGTVSGTDVDVEGLTFALVGEAPAGVTFNADGTFSVAPLTADQGLDDGESREVTFQYVANDGSVDSVAQTVMVTIHGVNDAPVAAAGVTAAGTEDDATINGAVSGTDVDIEGLTYALVGEAPAGVTFNADGTFSVAPLAADQGLDDGESREVTFQYVANDGTVDSAAQTVTVTIHGVNDAPVAAAGVMAEGTEDDAAINGTVSGTDVDVEVLTYALLGEAPTGVTFNADGTFSVAPLAADQGLDDGESREVTFQYVANDGSVDSVAQTVTVTIHGVNDTPVIDTSAASGVTAVGTEDDAAINGAVFGSDVDVEGLTYALVGEAPAGVTFNADGTFSVAPQAADQGLDDGESREVTFQYVANDGSVDSVAQTVTITIHGVNDAPVAAAGVTAEGTEDDAAINGAVSGTDVDVEGLNYALVGEAPAGVAFNADGTFSVAPQAADQILNSGESREVAFQYVANDGTADSAPQTAVVTIQGVNDAPTDLVLSNHLMTENMSTTGGLTVGLLSSIDPDARDSHAYSLVGNGDDFFFQIVGDQLRFRGGVVLNAEAKSDYAITLRSTDAGGLTVDRDVVIHLGDVDEFDVSAPVFDVRPMAGLSAPNTVPENMVPGTFTGISAIATDADVSTNQVTYALVGNQAGGAYATGEFAIDATTGAITVAGAIDREAGSSRTLYVQATSQDGSSAISSLTLFINDRNEFTVSTTSDVQASVNAVVENASVGTRVGITAQAVDGDATTNTVTYALVGAADGSGQSSGEFDIDPVSGVIVVAGAIDREAGATRTLFVQARSSDGSTSVTPFVVAVSDVNDNAPVFTSGTADSVTEGATAGTVVYLAQATDADATAVNNTVHYSLKAGGDAALLAINAATGAVSLRAAADFETQPAYHFTVVASDGTFSTEQAVNVAVANVQEAATGNLTLSGSAAEGSQITASLSATDPDGAITATAWQWQHNTGGAWSNLAGASAATLSIPADQSLVGQLVRPVATTTDSLGGTTVFTGQARTVVNVNDAPTGAVTLRGTAVQGQTLTATHNLADADGLGSIRYQWLADGVTLAGVTGDHLALGQALVGKSIMVMASYTDGFGQGESVVSGATEAVRNVNDAPTGTVMIDGQPVQGETLQATAALADVDGLGAVSYQWLADGVVIAGATGGSHLIGAADVGHELSVVAQYVDGQGTAESVFSGVTGMVNAVSSVVEGQAPGLGSNGAAGDGNGDGIPDARQMAVVSTPVTSSADGTSHFVTLAADTVGGKVSDTSTACITAVGQTAAPTGLPSSAQTPMGSLSFTAATGSVSGLETFSLYVDPSLAVNGYWVRNASGTLVNLASEAWGGHIVTEGDKVRLDFQIQDGSVFDKDGSIDGSIQQEGAVGYVPLSLIAYAPDMTVPHDATSIWD